MIKRLAWNTFKNTGDINTYLELKQITNIENTIANNIEYNIQNIKAENYETNKSKGNSNSRKDGV